MLNLLKMLIDRDRQSLFGEIADVYGEILDEARGRTHVRIVAAKPISDPAKDRLLKLLAERLGREIIAESVRDAMAAPRLGRNLLG